MFLKNWVEIYKSAYDEVFPPLPKPEHGWRIPEIPQSLNIGDFARISIPLVKKVYPSLIANKIVSVQPLSGPTGLVYYLRFRYSESRKKNGFFKNLIEKYASNHSS